LISGERHALPQTGSFLKAVRFHGSDKRELQTKLVLRGGRRVLRPAIREPTQHGDRNPTVRIGSRRHLTIDDSGGRQSLAATLAVVTTSLALAQFVIGTPRGPLLERAGIASVTRGSARSL
jgi:hypothetical protein